MQNYEDGYTIEGAWARNRSGDSESGNNGSSGSGTIPTQKSTKYFWDSENRMIKAEHQGSTTHFQYDASGQRTSKKNGNKESLYFDKMWQSTYTSPNTNANHMEFKNIYLGKDRLLTKLGNGLYHDKSDNSYQKENQYFNHANHIGSVNVISDSKGQAFRYIEYTPYGEQWFVEDNRMQGPVGVGVLEYGFTDHLHDEETGLIYANARYLDPKTSRWMSSDPAMADGLNWYRYANNNPIMYSDPTGLSTWITDAVDEDGAQDVLDAEADGDTNVYEWMGEGDAPSQEELQNRTDEEREADKTSGNCRVIGQTHFDDSHISPEIAARNDPNDKGVRGRVFMGSSMDQEVNDAYKKSFNIGIFASAFALKSGGEFDLKNRPGRRAYDSHMYDGQYMTWREAGNYLAGMIAGGHGVSWDNFQKQAGYLHQGGMWAVVVTLNWHRITGQVNYDNGRYGEVDYQYYRSQAGYAKGKQLGDPRTPLERIDNTVSKRLGGAF